MKKKPIDGNFQMAEFGEELEGAGDGAANSLLGPRKFFPTQFHKQCK